MIVQTDELFGHCAKAFRRGHVWDPAAWVDNAEAPDLAEIVSSQFDGIDADVIRDTVEAVYADDLAQDRPDA